MTHDVTLITPPDFLLNSSASILLITPSNQVKNTVNQLLADCTQTINVYLYTDTNIEWLLKCVKIADLVIYDLDNSDINTKQFESYLISQPNVFYLTKGDFQSYNLISKNRIYELSWLNNYFNRGTNE